MKQVLLGLALGMLGISASWGRLILADGEGSLPVTIHPEAGEDLRFAAEDLARIVGEMTGSRPEVVESTKPEGIVVGTVDQFGVFRDDAGLVIHDNFDGREAFIIRPDEGAKRVWILGNREDGASHGVYTLLRDHGYRALFPGANWEVIPKQATVAVEGPSEGRPKVLTRTIWAGFGTFDKEQLADVEKWWQRNRLGASIVGSIGHSWESMIRNSQEAFEENPQLYGEKEDGSLNKQSLRHGTEAVVDFTVDWFKRRMGSSRTPLDILSLAPTDGDNYTRDKETAARGPINESFYWYTNEVAKKMRELAPDRLVGTTAYYLHAKPPSFDLEPNVIVLGATMFGTGGLTLEDFFAEWSKRAKYIGIRDYIYSGYQMFADHPDMGYTKPTMERQAAWLRDFPIAYYSAEGLWEWGMRGIGYYTLAQLLWDPSQEVDAILEDFRKSAFGPAADLMATYYEALEPTGKAVRKFQMARAVTALNEAAERAKRDPAVTARLDDLMVYWVHVALLDQMKALDHSDPELLRLAAEDLAWNFRNRRSYILNYNANRRFWMVNEAMLGRYFAGRRIGNRNYFGVPDGEMPETPEAQNEVIARTLGEAWEMVGGYIVPTEAVASTLNPASPAEIREKFAQIVIPQYPHLDVDEVTYSTDYVPVDTGLQSSDDPSEAIWFGANLNLLCWRDQASDLVLRVTPNVRYIERVGNPEFAERLAKAPLEVRVASADGVVGEPVLLEQDHEVKEVTFQLPVGGLSELRFHTKRMGLELQAPSWDYLGVETGENTILFVGTPAAGGGRVAKSLYFYVPKGVDEIQAFSTSPAYVVKTATFSPVNGEVRPVQVDGELIRIPVAEGEDGQVWQVAGGGLGTRFYFLNLPNLLSMHPGKMLLPRELVESEGLRLARQ